MELVILGIVVALSLILLGPSKGLMSQVGSTTLEYNQTNKTLYAVSGVADWYGIIILAIVFVGLIGLMYTIYNIGRVQGGKS